MLCICILGRFAPSLPLSLRFMLTFLVTLLNRAWCFALAISVALLSQASCFTLSFSFHNSILDCFALSDFVLCTHVYPIVGCFAPSGLIVLHTHILSRFAPSDFGPRALHSHFLCLFATSSFALRAHILLAFLTNVSRFALTKFFEKNMCLNRVEML